MEMRLPASEVTRASELVGEVAHRHGLLAIPSRRSPAGNNLYVVPGYSGGPWPGQPDVDWEGGASWKLEIDRPQDLPDTIKCSFFPPLSGDVSKVLLSLTYAGQMPVVARPLWQDLKSEMSTRYGPGAMVTIEELK